MVIVVIIAGLIGYGLYKGLMMQYGTDYRDGPYGKDQRKRS